MYTEQHPRKALPATLLQLAALGALVPCGWLLHDLLRYLGSGDPRALAELVPGSLAAVALGALFGALLGRSSAALALALVASGVWSLQHKLFDVPYSLTSAWLPRVAFVLLAAFLLARLFCRLGLGRLRSGLVAGALGCALVTGVREPLATDTKLLLLAALACAFLGRVRRPSLRRVATVAAVAVPLVGAVRALQEAQRSGRPDLPPPAASAAPGAPNLLFIVLDTVRADHLAPYGHARVTTPRIDAFVRERATRYANARSAAAYTLPAHASLFTGLFPAEHGADHPRGGGAQGVQFRQNRPTLGLRPDVPTLASTLREHGYRTGAVVANNAFLHHVYGLDRGFERYDDGDPAFVQEYLALPQFAGSALRTGHIPYRDGDLITAAALRWLDGLDGLDGGRPFFLMLNYMDAHSPYFPPEEYAGAFADEQPIDPFTPDIELWPLLYDRTLLALDAHVGDLLDALEESGRLGDTAVVITSDHGEGFGEHDYYNHAWILYEEMIHVPLYVAPVRGAGERPPAVELEPISGVGVPHLMLDLLGLDVWPAPYAGGVVSEWYHGQPTPGVRAWAAANRRELTSDLLSWIEGGTKFIAGSDGALEAFDLAGDPGEQSPLELSPERRAAALARARQWWAEHPPVEAADLQLDEERMERLRDLGYLGE